MKIETLHYITNYKDSSIALYYIVTRSKHCIVDN